MNRNREGYCCDLGEGNNFLWKKKSSKHKPYGENETNFIISKLKTFVNKGWPMIGSEKTLAMFKTTKRFISRIYKKQKQKQTKHKTQTPEWQRKLNKGWWIDSS